MKKQTTSANTIKFTAITYAITIIVVVALVNACNKTSNSSNTSQTDDALRKSTGTAQIVPATQGQSLPGVFTIANIRASGDGTTTKVMFNENEEVFNIQDATIIATLKDAFSTNMPVQVSFNPWTANILSAVKSTTPENGRQVISSPNTARKVDLSVINSGQLDNTANLPPINTTSTGLTNVIPDFAAAQLMFDYISNQCCALPGPYGVSHCITFQYCEDGCYARAQMMCWIINNDYNYGTQKVFSFANTGTDELCVQGQKWGGCCVNWWYHVAPLVTIQTQTGPKAYVMDPAMFDQPVLLSVWLHAQENPSCVPSGDVPVVTMINVQPTTSYAPTDATGYHFNTDPLFVNTYTTLINYKNLTTCP